MLTVSPSQLTALNSEIRKVIYKVEIYRDDYPEEAIDISSDVEEIEITTNLEDRNTICRRLVIKNEDYSYSPRNKNSSKNLVNGEYNPLIYPNHLVKIYVGFTGASPEYWQIFTGIMGDQIDVSTYPGKIVLSVRDMSKKLQDSYVYLSKPYDYMLVEDVIQGLLNECKTGITLQVAEPTDFLIQHYQVKDMNLWDAIQKLADLMGWILIFTETGDLLLKKEKAGTEPDIVIDEDLIETEELSMSDSDIRNDIWVRAESPNGIIIVNVANPLSIAQFGRRFMEVDRSLASMLYTYDQAYNLAKKICNDLSWLHTVVRVSNMPLYPPIQVDDIVAISSSKSSLSTEELFKVYEVTHTITAEKKRTSLLLKSFVVTSEALTKIPKPPTNLSASLYNYTINNYPNSGWSGNTKTIYYPCITFTKPTQNTDDTPLEDLVGYVIARSETSNSEGFIDLRSIPAKDAIGNDVTQFIDYSATTGMKWYKIAAINSVGTRSDFSSVVAIDVPAPVIR